MFGINEIEINKLRQFIKPDKDSEDFEDGDVIDFNKIIPMPDSLHITCGSDVDRAIAIIKYQKGDDSALLKMLRYNWTNEKNIRTVGELANYFLTEAGVDLGLGRIALENEEKYGYRDWYSWSVGEWGTKWNAYNQIDWDPDIQFDTAWSAPIPVIEKLSELFPKVTILHEYADEDAANNVGILTYLDGKIIKNESPVEESKEAYELYFELHPGNEEYFELVDDNYIYKEGE